MKNALTGYPGCGHLPEREFMMKAKSGRKLIKFRFGDYILDFRKDGSQDKRLFQNG